MGAKNTGIPHGGIQRKATEVPTGELMKGVQDVAISTRIAISHAATAIKYAQITVRESKAVSDLSKEAKQRAKEVEKAEAKLQKAVEALKKVRNDLDSALRGSR